MAADFEYDGVMLSDFGYTICSFSSSGMETVPGGDKITFSTSPMQTGERHLLAGASYEECLSATFSICKIPCGSRIPYISAEERTALSRWLCRKNFCKLRLFDEGYENIYFEGSFHLDDIRMGGKTVGMALTFISNRPFGIGERIRHKINITAPMQTASITDRSDEIGFLYLDAEITCFGNGDLVIYNDLEDRSVMIRHCVFGEIITMKHPIIESSNPSHKIQNDFNFNFLRIANKWNAKTNRFTFSLPCLAKISYHPLRKVGIIPCL